MPSLPRLLLVVLLFLSQIWAGAHAVEHATGKDGLPTHACELCLAAHDLGSALPSLAIAPPVEAPSLVPEILRTHARSAFPPPLACQRAPPLA